MSILGKYVESDEQETNNYKIPAVFKADPKESLGKSIMVSTAIHPYLLSFSTSLKRNRKTSSLFWLIKNKHRLTKIRDFVQIKTQEQAESMTRNALFLCRNKVAAALL